MSEIKNDELNQATETSNTEAETPMVEEINEPKAKTTITDFFKKCFSKENLKKTIAVILLAAIVIGGVQWRKARTTRASPAIRRGLRAGFF